MIAATIDTGRDLLARVVQNTSDNASREAYAQWCHAMGMEDRAEVIRLQVQLDGFGCDAWVHRCNGQCAPLNDRIKKLFQTPEKGRLIAAESPVKQWAEVDFELAGVPVRHLSGAEIGWNRGFPSTWKSTWNTFKSACIGGLFRAAPLARVEIGIHPIDDASKWVLSGSGYGVEEDDRNTWCVPDELWLYLVAGAKEMRWGKFYDETRDHRGRVERAPVVAFNHYREALDAVSTVAVQYGRELAGLA